MNQERPAFDLTREAPDSLVANLASLTIEAAPEAQEERINPFTLITTGDGRVICPDTQPEKDIAEQFGFETELDRLQSEAALKVRSYLLSQDKPFLSIWLSPPSPYPEGRLTVGMMQKRNAVKEHRSYGIPVFFSEEQSLILANQILSFAKSAERATSANQLRQTAILIDLQDGQDPLEILEELIPLPKVWDKIRKLAPEKKKAAAKADAEKIKPRVFERLATARTRYEYLQIGAYAEDQMARMGHPMETARSGCGPSNTEVLNSFNHIHTQFNAQGNIAYLSVETNESEGKWEYHTGVCTLCREVTQVGPCNICKDCEKKS